jgi:hypothetical protein
MRRLPILPLRATVVALGLAGLFAAVAWAHHYKLESISPAVPFLRDGKVDEVIEASGVALIGDGRRALVADEKAAALHVVEVSSGKLIGPPLESPKFSPSTGTVPEWEGMARDSEGNYSLVGSHSGKSDEERAAHSAVVRFRLSEGESAAIDDASVVRWDITRSLEAALRGQGLDAGQVAKRKIEGLAVREGGGRRELVFGLREPGDKVRAFAANITKAPSSGAELELRLAFAFDAPRTEGVAGQLTSLEYVPNMGGFIVLTAAVDANNKFHGNTISYVSNGERRRATQHGTFETAMKAAGLAVLGVKQAGGQTEIKLLFTHDNDPHATKIPSRFQTALLIHPLR